MITTHEIPPASVAGEREDYDAPPANDGAPDDAEVTPIDLRIAPVPAEWYSTTPPRVHWLLRDLRSGDGVLPRGRVGLVVAEGGAGKTMAVCGLAVSIATGTPWLGAWAPDEPGRVLLNLGEEDAEEVQRRLYRVAHVAAGVFPAAGAIDYAALTGHDCALLARGETGDPIETSYLVALREHVAREQYALVVVDPLSRFAGEDTEKSNAWATRFIVGLESIAQASGATVLCCHHSAQWARMSKPNNETERKRRTADARDAATARGVTAITDGARWVAVMRSESIEHQLSEDDDRLGEIVTIAVAKSNYSLKGDGIECRRDHEYAGALVGLDDMDRQRVRAAREAANPHTAKLQENEAHKARVDEERKTRQAQGVASEVERTAAEDAAALAILAKHGPTITCRTWYAEMRAHLGKCSKERADAARARVRR